MIKEAKIIIRPAKKEDRSQLAHIIHFESYVHRHLDWRPPLDWIGHSPYYIAEKNNRIVGAIACPPDPKEVSWIRVFATTSKMGGKKAWNLLWPTTKDTLISLGTESVVAIPLQEWFEDILIHNNFSKIHNVVILVWESENMIPPIDNSSFTLRPMRSEELEIIRDVDGAAFGPIWRNSLDTLKLAFNQALSASVVENKEGKILGYQISTPSPFGAHLARLAVLPESQGQGIGYYLAHHVQSLFEGQTSARVSVNTQDNNLASLGLYKKLGFSLTGEVHPVYQCNLK